MADIMNEIAAIQVATTGSSIRSAIIDALSALNANTPVFYSGAYVINPSLEDIILPVSNKTMVSDLTIKSYPQPSFYSGAYEINPSALSQVLSVSGYLMSQDLIIDAYQSVPSEYQKVEYLETADNQDQLFNLVPCYRKSDSVAGFYDMETSLFYSIIGSVSFIAGPSI